MDNPRFTVEWESRWHEFWTSVPVVMQRLAPGTPRTYIRTGTALRAPAATITAELVAVVVVLAISPAVLRSSRGVALQTGFEHQAIYYFRQDLPNISDVNGADAGREGKSGGAHASYARQLIRIARGRKPVEAVADAPALRLPRMKQPTSNLLAVLANPAATRALPSVADVSELHNRAATAPEMAVVAPTPLVTAVRNRRQSAAPVLDLVSPPPDVAEAAQRHQAALGTDIVPPAPVVTGVHGAAATALSADAVPPAPVITGVSNSAGARLSADAVRPAPVITGQHSRAAASLGDVAVAGPPAPSTNRSGSTGRTGVNTNAGSTAAGAVVVSADAANAIGIPEGAMPGVTTMSPTGGSTPGAGGVRGSTGVGYGSGSGRGTSGSGNGSTNSGDGFGADRTAHNGTSSSAGPGGANRGKTPRAVTGVVVAGGVVDIPSFGSTAEPANPQHSPREKDNPPSVVVVATSNSGGGLPTYGVLHGSRVYTTYLDTTQGPVVLQYADPAPAGTDFDLTPPQLLRGKSPTAGKLLRTVIACVLDPSGLLKNVRVLNTDTPDGAALLARSLNDWRFRPALRGDKAVAVQAILAFGITTQ